MNSRWIIAVALTYALAAAWQHSVACDTGMVRDAAFDQPRDGYRLCVIARSDDPQRQEILGRLSAWLESTGGSLNLELVDVHADDADVRWSDYGIPSAPPELPVVVLVGKRPENGKDFFVDYWLPEPTAEDLDVLRSSPVREEIRHEVVKNLAVLVHVRGSGQTSEQAAEVIDRIRGEREGQSLGVAVVTLDRNEPRERLLLSFIGVAPEGPDWLGVVFGRGKFMAPLEGEGISEAAVRSLLETLAADCTCIQTPSRLGVDILMPWNQAADESLVRAAPIGQPVDTLTAVMSAKASAVADPSPPASIGTTRSATVVLWMVGGLILFSAAGSVVILWQRRRKSSS